MTPLGQTVADQFRQIFYHYVNRKSADNRGAQTHLGPSEIGTPCDRRLAFTLLGVPAVNPGGDGWAAFKGTWIHAGLAEVFQWANHGTGRFAVEVPLSFPTPNVPRGTADLLDRVLVMLDDHKIMGAWSLDSLGRYGPSPKYRVQAHVYGYGQRLKGERVDHVAVAGWPMEESSLDGLYVWTEPYDAAVAIDALKRVDDIAARVGELTERGRTKSEIARLFPVADDCRFCPFHAPGDKTFERGCNGR